MCDALFDIFPRLKFVDENSIHDQVVHVVSESNEVCDSLIYGETVFRTAEELVDVVVSAVTGLRILSEKHGVDIDDVVDHVNAKNSVRGYLAKTLRTAGAHSCCKGCDHPASPTHPQERKSCSNHPEGRNK